MEERLKLHLNKEFKQSYTAKQADDWIIFLIANCIDRVHARKVETFIKSMKSKKFIYSLLEDTDKLQSIITKNRSITSVFFVL
jgi:hypothetical protein